MATVRARAGIGTCARGSGAGTGFAAIGTSPREGRASNLPRPPRERVGAFSRRGHQRPGGASRERGDDHRRRAPRRDVARARDGVRRLPRASRRAARRASRPRAEHERGGGDAPRHRLEVLEVELELDGGGDGGERRDEGGERDEARGGEDARERRRGGDGERGDERRKRPRGGVRRVRASVATSARGGAATGRGDGEGRGRRVDERVVLGFGFGVRRSRLAARRARRGRTRGSSRFRLAASRAGPLALASFAILRRGRSPARGFRRGRARGRPGGILRVVPGGVRGAPSRLAPRSSTLLAERRADLLLGGALLVPDRARPLTPEPRNVRAIQPAELAAHVVGDVRERAAEIPRRARRGGTRALERAALPLAARRHRARTADDDAGGK